jgi:hypothetical protein
VYPPTPGNRLQIQSDNVVVVTADSCDVAEIIASRSDTHGMGTNLSKGRHVSAARSGLLPILPPTSSDYYPSTECTADVLYKFFLGTVKKYAKHQWQLVHIVVTGGGGGGGGDSNDVDGGRACDVLVINAIYHPEYITIIIKFL